MKKRRKIGKTRRKTSRNKPLKKNLKPQNISIKKANRKRGKKTETKKKANIKVTR
jgi:hypothetical protein